MVSLYDVLLVERNATLDEIKLAFKRRALQVHPDKGGSKEAFHLVYQALETLADPTTRKSYDHALSTKPRTEPLARQRKTDKRNSFSKEPRSKQHIPKEMPRAKKTARRTRSASESSPSMPTKLLVRIRDLLKRLSRDVRNEALSKDFSQQQRLILEKWMVDEAEAGKSLNQDTIMNCVDLPCGSGGSGGSCTTLALSTKTGIHKGEDSDVPLGRAGHKKRMGEIAGCVKKCHARGLGEDARYIAMIKFDAVEMYSGLCDLPTALEILVILTSVKQKMLDRSCQDSFEKRLQEALQSSAQDQGRDYAQLNIRYAVLQSAGFFLGPGLISCGSER